MSEFRPQIWTGNWQEALLQRSVEVLSTVSAVTSEKMSHFGWVIIGDFSNFSNFGGFKGENKALRIETAVKTVLNNKN